MKKDILVSFARVKKSFDGENLVVKNLNLDIKTGEFVTLLGPSGSGKTTCLMMLAGFESVTSGEIKIDDQSIQDIPPNKRNIGMVFQDYALFPHMTVSENLSFPLEIRKLSKKEIKQKVGDALQMVSLAEYEGRKIGQLSGGQKQRIAVARALIFRPKIILMDEPLGALDKNLREEMQFELMHLHDSLGITFIYVTHDQSEAITMSDRIAVFDDGEIQQYDTPTNVWEKPQNSFVAFFIGENNSLPGKVKKIDKNIGSIALETGEVIQAQAVNVAKSGESCSVAIRPERILIGDEATKAKGPNYSHIKGKILEIIYMGDHTRIRMLVAASQSFIIKLANSKKHGSYKLGENIPLAWKNEDGRALI